MVGPGVVLSPGVHRGGRAGARPASIAEYVKLGAASMDEALPVRRHHRPDLPRGALLPQLSQARGAAGGDGGEQPVHVDRRRQVLRRHAGHQLGVASPRPWRSPTRRTSPASCPSESLRNLQYPLDWKAIVDVHRAALHPQGRPRRRLEGGLRLPLPGRADPPLRQLRPADHGGAGVHRVGAVRPLPLHRPGGDPADEVRSAGAAVPRGARAPVARARARAWCRMRAPWCGRWATT